MSIEHAPTEPTNTFNDTIHEIWAVVEAGLDKESQKAITEAADKAQAQASLQEAA
jgi:hypothetical protein